MKKMILLALLLMSNLSYAEGIVVSRETISCPPNLRCEATEGDQRPEGYNLPEPEDLKKKA